MLIVLRVQFAAMGLLIAGLSVHWLVTGVWQAAAVGLFSVANLISCYVSAVLRIHRIGPVK